jgi:hypothetical protein
VYGQRAGFYTTLMQLRRVIFKDLGQIIEDCPKDEFFGKLAARSDRTLHFLSKYWPTDTHTHLS